MTIPRILVCGGRDFDDLDLVDDVLENLCRDRGWITEPNPAWSPKCVIIHGGARGADTLGGVWAKKHGLPCEEFVADRQGLGRKAGPIRNQRMIDEGKPDLVVAFPGGRGTADMVRRARAAGIEVIEVCHETPAQAEPDGPCAQGQGMA